MSRKVSAARLYAIYPWQELRRTDGRWLESQVKLADSESWISLGIYLRPRPYCSSMKTVNGSSLGNHPSATVQQSATFQ